MSRDMLDGMPDLEKRSEEEYEPGILSIHNHELVEELVTEYLTYIGSPRRIRNSDIQMMSSTVHEHAEELRVMEPEEAQGFLDDVIWTLNVAEEWTVHEDWEVFEHAYFLLSPVVKHLYWYGKNELVLDFRPWPQNPRYVMHSMVGNEEDPLLLNIILSRASIALGECELFSGGLGAQHAQLTVSGGVYDVGCVATDSRFIINGKSAHIGRGAADCDFYFPKAEHGDVYKELKGKKPSRGIYELDIYSLKDYSFSFTAELERRKRTEPKGDISPDFFERGNRIFIADQDNPGEWKEVTP